jgi:hypothetical protein
VLGLESVAGRVAEREGERGVSAEAHSVFYLIVTATLDAWRGLVNLVLLLRRKAGCGDGAQQGTSQVDG